MTHVSSDNFEGFPGAVIATVTFELTVDNEFNVNFDATPSKPTPINMTNHAYFNLAGHVSSFRSVHFHSTFKSEGENFVCPHPIRVPVTMSSTST